MGKIDTSQWKPYRLADIFVFKRPKARVQIEYEEGDTPFVSSGGFNNGIVFLAQPKENEVLDKGGCISVSPLDGYTFYQEKDFLGRGGSGASIVLLYNSNLNRYNSLFVCSIIRTICRKYNYSDLGSGSKLKDEVVLLPSLNNSPDWEYMENYIKDLKTSMEKSYNSLSLLVNQEKQ